MHLLFTVLNRVLCELAWWSTACLIHKCIFPDMQIPIDTPLTNGIGIWPTMSMIRLPIFVGNCLEFLGISHCIQIYPNMCWLNPGFAWLNPHYFPYKMPVPAMLQSVLTRGPCPDLHRDLALWFGRAHLSHPVKVRFQRQTGTGHDILFFKLT